MCASKEGQFLKTGSSMVNLIAGVERSMESDGLEGISLRSATCNIQCLKKLARSNSKNMLIHLKLIFGREFFWNISMPIL